MRSTIWSTSGTVEVRDKLEHQVTMMTPVATSATAITMLNAKRRERWVRRSPEPASEQRPDRDTGQVDAHQHRAGDTRTP